MKRWGRLFLMSMLGMLWSSGAVNAFADELNAHMKVIAYSPNTLVPLTLHVFSATQFILNPDEHILDSQSGDTGAWRFDDQFEPPYMFFIKPQIPDSSTNLTIVTDKRSYYFHLVASTDLNADDAVYVVRMTYPDEEKQKMLRAQAANLNLSKDPSAYHWNYSYNGSRTILPMHVFDDGRFTYLELQPNQPVPAIFAVDNAQGHESVVNFRRQGSYLVVERIAPQFTLRSGQYDVVSLFNDDLINNLRNGGNHA